MKNRILAFLIITITINAIGVAQSPFIKSNTGFKSKLPNLDSINVNFDQSLDKILQSVKSLDNISKTDVGFKEMSSTKALDSLKREYSSKKSDDSLYTIIEEELEKQLEKQKQKLRNSAVKNEKDKELIKEMRLAIDNTTNELRLMRDRIDRGDKALKAIQVDIEKINKESDEIKFRNLQLQNQIVNFQYEKYTTALSDLTRSANEISDEVESLEKSLTEMKWIEDKVLDSSDNKFENKLSIEIGVKKAEASQAIAIIKRSLSEISKRIDYLKDRTSSVNILIGIGINESLRPVLIKEFASIDSINKIIENDISSSKSIIKENVNVLRNIQLVITENQKKMVELYKKYAIKKDTDNNNLEAIAGITQPLGKVGQLVPNITLLGYKATSDENSSMSSQLKLFIGANAQEQETFNSNYKLFIPEMSTFGFAADFSLGFIPSTKTFKLDSELRQPIKKLGINLGTYYLGKNLNKSKDSTELSIGILQFKTGLQYILIGKVLSVYANINSFFITNGLDNFKESFNYEKKLIGFVDFGLECYLDIVDKSKGGGLFIDLDLGFISAGGDVKKLVPGNDPLIPRIRIGLVKGFKF